MKTLTGKNRCTSMFIAGFFTIAKTTYVFTDGWMDKKGGINGILFSHKKNDILLLETTWLNLEGIMLSEVSLRETSILWSHLYVEGKITSIATIKTKLMDTGWWLPEEGRWR